MERRKNWRSNLRPTAHSEVVELFEGGLRPPFATTYRDEDHQYWINGESVPSVTQVVDQLHNFSGGNQEALARAAARGTLIHKACELFILGTLDWCRARSPQAAIRQLRV